MNFSSLNIKDAILVGMLTSCSWPLYIYSYKQSKLSPVFSIGIHACRILTIINVPLLESKINHLLDIYSHRNSGSVILSYGLMSLGILAPLDEIQFQSTINFKRLLWLAISYTTEALVFHLVFSRLEVYIHPSERNYLYFRYVSLHFVSLVSSSFIGNTLQNYRISPKIFYKFLNGALIDFVKVIKVLLF